MQRSSGLARVARALLKGAVESSSQSIEHGASARAAGLPQLAAQLRDHSSTSDARAVVEHPQFRVLAEGGAGSVTATIRREPVYAVFELGATQYKVSAGDLVYTERLRGADVGTEISLDRVQLAGSAVETLVGRPYVEGAAVTAVVEVSLPALLLAQPSPLTSWRSRR